MNPISWTPRVVLVVEISRKLRNIKLHRVHLPRTFAGWYFFFCVNIYSFSQLYREKAGSEASSREQQAGFVSRRLRSCAFSDKTKIRRSNYQIILNAKQKTGDWRSVTCTYFHVLSTRRLRNLKNRNSGDGKARTARCIFECAFFREISTSRLRRSVTAFTATFDRGACTVTPGNSRYK